MGQQILPLAATGEASKMAAARSLTLEMLLTELDKSRRSVIAELTASLKATLALIHSSLESIINTMAKHTSTISEMETALSTQSDNITSLEQEVLELRSKLTSITEEHDTFQATVALGFFSGCSSQLV